MKVNICDMELEKGEYKIGEFSLNVGKNDYYLYDKNNNKIRYEDSDGYSYIREYDKNKNIIKFEASDGCSWIREYDKDGKRVFSSINDAVIFDVKLLREVYIVIFDGFSYYATFDCLVDAERCIADRLFSDKYSIKKEEVR